MKKSEITSFFNIYNQIQKVVNELDLRSPHQYNVRIRNIKDSTDGPFDYIVIQLDIYNEKDTEDGFFFNINIPQKYLDNKHKNDLQKLIDSWVKLIHTNIYKIQVI